MSRSKFAKWDPNLPETRTMLRPGYKVDDAIAVRAQRAARPISKRYAAALSAHIAAKVAKRRAAKIDQAVA